MTRVLIVDDHQLIREGFRRLIDREPDMALVATAGRADEALDALASTPCEVVVLDIGLPDRDGLDLLKDLRATYPGLRVLMLSMHAEEHFALRALKGGAAGYICKGVASNELVHAIRRIAAGGKYVSEELGDRLVDELSGAPVENAHERLSDRELQVLVRIGKGESTRDIAEELHLSVNTVNTYRRRILEKMNLHSSADIVGYAVRHGLG